MDIPEPYCHNYLERLAYSAGYAKSQVELERLRMAQELVARQAEDAGLWFVAETAPEAYLQKALRALHTVIESEADKTVEEHGELVRLREHARAEYQRGLEEGSSCQAILEIQGRERFVQELKADLAAKAKGE